LSGKPSLFVLNYNMVLSVFFSPSWQMLNYSFEIEPPPFPHTSQFIIYSNTFHYESEILQC